MHSYCWMGHLYLVHFTNIIRLDYYHLHIGYLFDLVLNFYFVPLIVSGYYAKNMDYVVFMNMVSCVCAWVSLSQQNHFVFFCLKQSVILALRSLYYSSKSLVKAVESHGCPPQVLLY
eukprot:1596_1